MTRTSLNSSMLWSFTPAARREGGPSNFCARPSPTTRPWICPKSRRAGWISISASQPPPASPQRSPARDLADKLPSGSVLSALDAEVGKVDANGEPYHDEREVYGRGDQRTRTELSQEGKNPRTPREEHVDTYRK